MVDVSKYIMQKEFLKPDHVRNSLEMVAIIIGTGDFKKGKFGRQLVLPINYNGKHFNFGCGVRNTRIITEKLGVKDTDFWIGKKLRFKIVDNEGKEGIEVDDVLD